MDATRVLHTPTQEIPPRAVLAVTRDDDFWSAEYLASISASESKAKVSTNNRARCAQGPGHPRQVRVSGETGDFQKLEAIAEPASLKTSSHLRLEH